MEIPAYIIERFGKSIEEIQKAKTEVKQENREIIFEVKQAEMDASECKKLCKKIGVDYKEGYEARVLDYVCSDERVDRMGDIIKQKGWDLNNFKTNPVIMGFHNYSTYPVGNSLKTKVDEGKLKMAVLFASAEIDEAADKAFRFAKSGFMKAGSVGFLPIEYHYPDDKERETLGMNKYGVVFDKSELMEFSVCGVPANPGALQESINKGLTTKKDFYGMVDLKIYDELIEFVEPKGQEIKNPGEPETKEVPENNTVEENEELQKNIKKYVNDILSPENKAGAKLSKKSKTSIKTAISGMESAVTALNALLEETDNSEEGKSTDSSSIDIDLDTETDDEEDYYPDGAIIEIDD